MDQVVTVPATSANLGPGFDTLGVALARHLVVRTGRVDGPRVVTVGADSTHLPDDDDNLVWHSFVRGCDRFGHPVPDLRLDVTCEIPAERGLGSSSAAIVAGLTLARTLADTPVPDHELVALASAIEGHPDNVAPAVLGGLVSTATGPDSGLVLRRGQPSPALAAVVAVPELRSRTDHSRGVVPDGVDRLGLVDQLGRLSHLVGGLLGAWPLDAAVAGDDFHEPARLAHQPAAAALVTGWRAQGVFAVLSGAGPSVAALVERRPATIEQALQVGREAAVAAGHEVELAVLDWDLRGARVRPSA